ncbi:MAG: WXG100 family type VII secretion target [Pseudonocardiales bacterium]
MPGFDVVPEELHAAAAQLRQLGSEARSELSRLGGEAGALLDGGWRGQAAAAFERGWAQWSAGASEVLDALEAMARLLAATGSGYDTAEEHSVQRLTGTVGQF